ncbi:MAG: hypothetical protein JWP89_328 [Schlesneria sp.]|nr:hypothetical protein [Schlesneria sp.]
MPYGPDGVPSIDYSHTYAIEVSPQKDVKISFQLLMNGAWEFMNWICIYELGAGDKLVAQRTAGVGWGEWNSDVNTRLKTVTYILSCWHRFDSRPIQNRWLQSTGKILLQTSDEVIYGFDRPGGTGSFDDVVATVKVGQSILG